MEFKELVTSRYSVRHYQNKEVELHKLETILEAGRMAPSAVNFQPWQFIVINDNAQLKKLAACYHREWFTSAPACIIVCGDHKQSWRRKEDGKDHCDIDVAIAIDHMTLQAVELGLGTCWVCNFDVKKTNQLLNLPAHIEVMAFLPLGYPKTTLDEPKKIRKELNEIVHWNTFKG